MSPHPHYQVSQSAAICEQQQNWFCERPHRQADKRVASTVLCYCNTKWLLSASLSVHYRHVQFVLHLSTFLTHFIILLSNQQIHGNISTRFTKYTYLLTPWWRVLPEQLTGLQLVKKFLAFHGTRRFINALTSVRHLSLSWASPIQSTCPHPTSCRSIAILSTYLRLGLPSCLFPSGFPAKTL